MNAGKAVYGILSANSGVTDIVGTNIFPEIAEQETAVPFVVYQLQSVDPDDTHDGPSKLDEVRFEFLCYADSYNAAADLGVAVRAALDRVSGTYNGVHVESVQFNDVDVNIEYDPRRYSQVLTFTFRIKRDDVTIALGTPVTGAVLGDLSDVDVTGVTNGQLIAYNSTSGNWEAANDAGGAEQLNDLSDVIVNLPATGEVLIYDGGEFVNDNIAISNVTGLQAALDATPDALDDLTDVKIVGTPTDGDALVYSSGFWARGTAGASTLGDLSDVNLTTPSTGAYLQYDGANWIDSVITLPSVPSTYYHNRYATEAETLRAGATATVELYYTAQADGDGYAESASSDTATTGFDIRRKLYYSEAAQADPDTGTWVQFAAIADNTTFVNAKAALLAYLKERTGGTVPISLKQTWEEVAQAPAFTGLLNESYGSGASAAYSVRRLNGNYTGAAIQVERSSDNTTQDIGFDSNGDLDESALSTFCSGTVCKVRTWYGQEASGGTGSGNDAVQTDHTKQPTIYTGGAIVKENGRVAVDFNKANSEHFEFTSADFAGDYIDLFLTGLIDTYGSNGSMLLGSTTGGATYWQHGNTDGYFVQGAGSGTAIAVNNSTRYLFNQFSNSTTINVHLSGADFSDSFAVSAIPSGSRTYLLGKYPTGTNWNYDGKMQEFVAYPSQRTTGNRTSIESNIGDYFTQNTPLLDTYTGAAAAYSLRKLRTAYTGSAIRVRRASDNAESDIGFNVFGELSTVELAAFCGSSDGFVKTWYCQSGNANDATQTNTANQPKIYDSVTGVVTENGKPAVEFIRTSATKLAFTTGLSSQTNIIAIAKNTDTSWGTLVGESFAGGLRCLSSALWDSSTNNDDFYHNGSLFLDGVQLSTGTAASNVQRLIFANAASGGYTDTLVDIGEGYSGRQWSGPVQEVILYASDQSTNRTNIEDNINTFYSIY